MLNVLFLCTGNSARSILAEQILNKVGAGRFHAYSAGSMPKGEVHPQTLATLKDLGYSTDGLRSKSWDEFTGPNAPKIDLIITVCDNAASEPCPVWPGRPASGHWGLPDPAAPNLRGQAQKQAFKDTHDDMLERIQKFVALPIEQLDQVTLKKELVTIGESQRGRA